MICGLNRSAAACSAATSSRARNAFIVLTKGDLAPPHGQNCSIGLNRKFQRCLARFRSAELAATAWESLRNDYSFVSNKFAKLPKIEPGIDEIIAEMQRPPYLMAKSDQEYRAYTETAHLLSSPKNTLELQEAIKEAKSGSLLAALGGEETQIEASFCAAIRIAREQKSASLEKSAETTYAEYRRQRASGWKLCAVECQILRMSSFYTG
jgi:hypothetical protein